MLLSTLSICCRRYKLFPCYLSCCLWTPTNRDRDPGTACADVQGWERSITAPHCTCSPSWLGGESSASALLSTVRRTNILPWETLLPPPLQPARHLKRWPLELAGCKRRWSGRGSLRHAVTAACAPAPGQHTRYADGVKGEWQQLLCRRNELVPWFLQKTLGSKLDTYT